MSASLALLAGLLLTAGCQRSASTMPQTVAPAIPVSKPIARQVTDFVEFTGRTEAVQAVDVRARVTGYLVSMPFKEGSEVKGPENPAFQVVSTLGILASPDRLGPLLAGAGLNHALYQGDVLFQIDVRPYQAQFDQALGQLNLIQAQLKLAQSTYARDLAIGRTGGAAAISQQQLDQDKAAVDEAEARVKAYQASMEVYRLNLNFTKVTAPIDGMVSRYYLTAGNLVIQDQTLLTTVVSLDPMYAYFAMDEPTLLRIRRAINEGKIKRRQVGSIPVYMALQGETGFPHQGTVDFVNNQVDPTTGSIAVRGVFANPKPAEGTRLLSPGMFVRIRLPIGQAHPALLVIDRAIATDQGMKKYVYVVDDKGVARYQTVTTGALQEDGLRVVTDGLKPDDWVVVGALQQVRPNMPVRTDQVPMPTIGGMPAASGKQAVGSGQ